jgi:hypothetical protein
VKPSISDVIIFLGLVLLGTGLFFCVGLGISLAVVGALVFLLGIAANVADIRIR